MKLLKFLKYLYNNFFFKNRVIKNLYNTKFNKSVLIVYLTSAFNKKKNISHSNLTECRTFAEIFKEMGYNIDVINLNRTMKIKKQYDVILGMDVALERSFFNKKDSTKHIFYATGACPIYSNMISTKKARDFYYKNKILPLDSIRKIEYTQDFQIFLSDSVIVLGNDFVKNTYLQYDDEKQRYKYLDAFYFDIINPDISKKDFRKARRNFIWFGSLGALHKGLDIVIDYFLEYSEYNLYICGLNTSEKKFLDFYMSKINNKKNIHLCGFLKIGSIEFNNLVNNCAFALYPSLSEGGSPALLNIIANGGIIPIHSKQVGIDFDKGFSFELEENTSIAIGKVVSKIEVMSDNDIKNMAIECTNYVRSHFTYEKYKNNLKDIIENILKK
jgi:glycosyltransferase, group 1 family